MGPLQTRSPTVASILAWRRRIATKYRNQLDETFTWDEDSTYETSEEVATDGDVMLHYAAAVLDQRGRASKLMPAASPKLLISVM